MESAPYVLRGHVNIEMQNLPRHICTHVHVDSIAWPVKTRERMGGAIYSRS